MRALKALVIALAVLIVGATAALIVLIVLKATALAPRQVAAAPVPPKPPASAPAPGRPPNSFARTPPPSGVPSAVLDQPAGSRILAMVPVANGLALALSGGGEADRIVIIDPTTGRVVKRIELAR